MNDNQRYRVLFPVCRRSLRMQLMRAVEGKHPRIQAERARRGIVDADVLTARWSIPNPVVMTDNGTAEYTYRLGLTQKIELGGKRRRRISLAMARYAVLESDLRVLAASLRADARRTYMDAFFAQERERMLIELIRSIDELLAIADARPGDIPKADVLEVRIIRLKARQALENSKFEHLQADIRLNGHALQCRITTEDPEQNFIPDYGRITAYRGATGFGIRLDAGTAYTGAVITPYYDSLLVKVTAWAPTAAETTQRMDRALREFRIRGVATNLPFLENLINHPAFIAGEITTRFIETTPELLAFSARRDRATKLLGFLAETVVLRALLLSTIGERELAQERAGELEKMLRGSAGLQRAREVRGDLAARDGDRQAVVNLLEQSQRPTAKLALALALGGGKPGEQIDFAKAHALMEELSKRSVNELETALTRGRARAWLKQNPESKDKAAAKPADKSTDKNEKIEL